MVPQRWSAQAAQNPEGDDMRKLTPYLSNGCPKLCWGCGQPFPVRDGRVEAQVGQDGRLYCYAMTPECAALAVTPVDHHRAA
jgi:hypothetical protein